MVLSRAFRMWSSVFGLCPSSRQQPTHSASMARCPLGWGRSGGCADGIAPLRTTGVIAASWEHSVLVAFLSHRVSGRLLVLRARGDRREERREDAPGVTWWAVQGDGAGALRSLDLDAQGDGGQADSGHWQHVCWVRGWQGSGWGLGCGLQGQWSVRGSGARRGRWSRIRGGGEWVSERLRLEIRGFGSGSRY